MSHLSRREFMQNSAQTAALTALGVYAVGSPSSLEAANEGVETPSSGDGVSWQKAPCRFCGTGCGVLVGVENARVVAVQGDKDCPVNRGLLCMKGYHAGALLYGEDRLTTPLIRKRGKLRKTSWDDAITLIAKKMMKDPTRFSIYGSGQWTIVEGYTAMKFLKGGLSNNHLDPNARLCMASAVVGFLTTFGVDEPAGCYDDLDHCDTIITWGNNWAEMHPVLYSRVIDRRGRGEEVTYIDIATRRTRSTEAADDYLEFAPQTDMAIANCIAHQLLERGTYDKAFVKAHVRFKDDAGKNISLKDYRLFLADYSPEKVSALSGVPVDKLTMLGDLFSDRARKIVSLWCMGVNQHTRGTAMNNLIYNVHLLSGQICKLGSSPFSLTGQPSACGTCREVGTLAHALPGGRLVAKAAHRKEVEDVWGCTRGAINAKPGFHTVKMFKAFHSGELTGMWVQVTNPAQSLPNLNALVHKGKNKFLVVSDIYPTETTRIADVVLPSATWVEKNGVFGNTERRTQQWFKMVEPPGQARDDVWQMIAVARKMYDMGFEGLRDRNGGFLLSVRDDAGNEVEAWKWEVFKGFNVDRVMFNEYRQLTLKKHKDLAPYDVYTKVPGLRWPVVKGADGTWRETTHRFVGGIDPYVKKGKKVDFYMAKGKDGKAIGWARPYAAPPEMPDTDYPFWLCTGRVLEHWHTGTMTGRIKELKQAMPNAYVELHPEDAKALSVVSGDRIRISSRRGQVEVLAWVNGRGTPQKGLVFVPFFDEEHLINDVTLDAFCPKSKEPDYKKCAVKVEKVA